MSVSKALESQKDSGENKKAETPRMKSVVETVFMENERCYIQWDLNMGIMNDYHQYEFFKDIHGPLLRFIFV